MYVRDNHLSLMNKFLSKAIMIRTRLRPIFVKNRSEENKINYNRQKNMLHFREKAKYNII